MRVRQLEKGAAGFDQYYSELFGERWAPLVQALSASKRYATLSEGLLQPYYLDAASAAVAEILPIAGANEVVDLCAAPGGKSLILAQRIARSDSPRPRLILNEKSSRRRRRLIRVLDDHLPPDERDRIAVYGHDAARWGIHRPESADAVLADVPCSSESHVLADPAELATWSPRRIRRNAVQQHAILAAAIDATRPGGYVLYATCALTPEENDDVIAWALGRREGRITVVDLPELLSRGAVGTVTKDTATPNVISESSVQILTQAETTSFGLHILPDRCDGAGPLYCALLHRR